MVYTPRKSRASSLWCASIWGCTIARRPHWQHSTDPHFVDKATPVLDLYEHAQALAAQGEAVVCSDEKTSIQARQRVSATKPAAPGSPLHVADRYKRMGAVQLFCALVVASGLTFARTRSGKKFADFKERSV